jgi:CDP-4-dehydro-6-deoxyglucose reductase
MQYQVKVLPSDTHFLAGEEESVLTAALQAGFNLPYGCRNGACGACKGKVMAGQVTYDTAFDPANTHTLSAEELASGQALFCCARPMSDLVIESRSIVRAGFSTPRMLPVRVQSLQKLADDVMLMQIKLPAQEHLDFIPGQYLEFILKNGKRRAFSMASLPQADHLIDLHLRLVPDGMFTSHVFNEMQEKAILRIEAPFGQFCLQENSELPKIFVAGGTGFAPIKAMIESLLAQGLKQDIFLYWGARTQAGLYLQALVESWQAKAPLLHFVPVLSEQVWSGRNGYVHQAVLADFDTLAGYEVYCCGAPEMVSAAKSAFLERGLAEQCFFADVFSFAADGPGG